MKVVFTTHNIYLTEADQTNPLRWATLKKWGKTFINKSPIFKCKDYLNDFVTFKQCGRTFTQYGMPSDLVHFDSKGGVWLLLCNVTPNLAGNIERVINAEFKSTWGVEIKYLSINKADVSGPLYENNYAAIYIPKQGWTSTFRISLLSLLIRNCNVKEDIANYDAIITPKLAQDGCLDDARYTILKERKYMFPSEGKFVYYLSSTQNSETTWEEYMKCSVHNNGIMGFTYSLRDEFNVKGWYTFKIAYVEEDEDDDYCDDECFEDEEECR